MTSLETTNYATDRELVLAELQRTLAAVDEEQVEAAEQILLRSRRVFATGAGRSGLALRMAAMRLMHLGLTVHVVGESTTPAITKGDVLLVASGSGTTAGAVQAAETAIKAGAQVLAITTARESKLGKLATHLLTIPAATKQDHRGARSEQYAGALFEQSVLLLMDILFQAMWRGRGESAEELWKRHANLE
jgi:6-phospho-3-hexuloisomerase